MHRRAFVGRMAAFGTVLLAGCSSPPGATTPTPDPDEPGTETDEPGTKLPQGNHYLGTEFTVDGRTSGQQRDEATIRYEDNQPAVTVEGVIWGPDGCTTAELVDVETGSETLALTVGTTRADGTDVGCTQAIVEIEYAATSTFQHGVPGRTVVTHVHDGERVQVAEATQ